LKSWAFWILIIFFSCIPDEEKFTNNPDVRLRFSADTLLFDTVFTSIGSITKRLRVFNDDRHAVIISEILLGSSDSPYTVTVNGFEGNSFENQSLLGKDSMLVLVEVTVDPQDVDLPFIVQDSLTFVTNGNSQNIKLISWGQDANFINDSVLVCNTTWTSNRPYVIFNSVLVDSLCQLTIEEGTNIFSHNGSSVFVKGTLVVNGSANNRVVFRNDRLDEKFENAPGQWSGIFFLEGSKNNQINFTAIRNAEFGIWLGTPDDDIIPDLTISNTIIENMTSTGLIAFTSDLVATNLLINNCGQYALGNFAGGNYTYTHCTISNFAFDFFREDPTLGLSDNLVLSDNTIISAALTFEMKNSLIWGNMQEEILIDLSSGNVSNILFDNNILKTTLELDSLNILNADPLFLEPVNFNYRLDTLSPAKDIGHSLGILSDLDGNLRDNFPDLGAYERIE